MTTLYNWLAWTFFDICAKFPSSPRTFRISCNLALYFAKKVGDGLYDYMSELIATDVVGG